MVRFTGVKSQASTLPVRTYQSNCTSCTSRGMAASLLIGVFYFGSDMHHLRIGNKRRPADRSAAARQDRFLPAEEIEIGIGRKRRENRDSICSKVIFFSV